MMSLVDYEASGESEVDEPASGSLYILKKDNELGTNHQSLFASLPAPIKSTELLEEEIDEFLNKRSEIIEKPSKRIKIDVPELGCFSEEFNIEHVPVKEKTKSCGLFSVLPPPKVVPLKNTSFVPKPLQKNGKLITASVKVSEAPKIYELSEIKINKELVIASDSEDEESDFLFFTKFDDQAWNDIFLKKKKLVAGSKIQKPNIQPEDQGVIQSAPKAEKPYSGLDNLAFKELFGNKKLQKINMIEIEEDVIHPDREEWLKSLTDPNFEASPEIKTPVNRTSLVKNHITSLAERALANDKDLQIRWSESRHSRNQTRVKYGF